VNLKCDGNIRGGGFDSVCLLTFALLVEGGRLNVVVFLKKERRGLVLFFLRSNKECPLFYNMKCLKIPFLSKP